MWIGGVRVVIRDEDDKILMVRQQHEGRDIWMVPGGAIEEGKTPMKRPFVRYGKRRDWKSV